MENFNSVLFLGVGGISMNQLAIAVKDMGAKVFGYDRKLTHITKQLEEKGIKISKKFENSFCFVDLCVKTPAIKDNNRYIQEMKKRGIKIVDRAELLGWLCQKFKNVIAVAGTHGKTTTSTLIYEILKAKYRKVSCHIGAEIEDARFSIGDDFLVVEACEFNKSFLHLFPTVTVITNVEKEHMETYGTIFNLRACFLKFFKRGEKRFAFDCESTKFLKRCANVVFVNDDIEVEKKLKGEHNKKNIALAFAVCKSLGVEEKIIKMVVKNFEGVKRRDECVGKVQNTKIFIDYAHHPTEVKAFADMFQNEFQNCLIVFQPHTYSRTKTFLKDFIKIFSEIKNLIIFKEYPAREKPEQGTSAKELCYYLQKNNINAKYLCNAKSLKKNLTNYDAVAFVGAGDINEVATKIVKSYQKNG